MPSVDAVPYPPGFVRVTPQPPRFGTMTLVGNLSRSEGIALRRAIRRSARLAGADLRIVQRFGDTPNLKGLSITQHPGTVFVRVRLF